MLLCASNADKSIFGFLRPPENAKVGDRVSLEGHEALFSQTLQSIMNPKKNLLEKILHQCATNEQGEAMFNGKRWKLSSGEFVKCESLKNGSIS